MLTPQDYRFNQPASSTEGVDNGAFSAIAVADGRPVVERASAFTDRVGVIVEILDDGDSTVAEIIGRDGYGVPASGIAVSIRVHQRGSSVLVTALGGVLEDRAVTPEEVAAVLRVLLDGENTEGPDFRLSGFGGGADCVDTSAALSSNTEVSERRSARGIIATEVVDSISACVDGDTGLACAAVLSATVGGQVSVVDDSRRAVVSTGDISWPAVPKVILETTVLSSCREVDFTPEVSVIMRPTPVVRNGRRELEWRSPEYQNETCSVTIERGPRGAKLTVRTVDSFDPAAVLETLIRVLSEWSVDVEREVDRPAVRSIATQDSGAIDPLGGELVGEAEEFLASQLCRVLGLKEGTVGGEDNFFRLGGDSMGALTLATSLGEQGWALDVQDVFQCPHVRSLATRMSRISTSSVREDRKGGVQETFAVDLASDQVSAPSLSQAAEPMSASGLDAATLAALVGDNSSAGTLAGDQK